MKFIKNFLHKTLRNAYKAYKRLPQSVMFCIHKLIFLLRKIHASKHFTYNICYLYNKIVYLCYKLLCKVLPPSLKIYLYKYYLTFLNYDSINSIVSQRCAITQNTPSCDPLTAKLLDSPVNIDICVVTYNSARWIDNFAISLLKTNYPAEKISIYFIDNNSQDNTLDMLNYSSAKLSQAGFKVYIKQLPKNIGFGAANNVGIKLGKSDFILVTNIDLTFDKNALLRAVSTAYSDTSKVASWEFRQKPYEHPKFYDPVTGITNWSSHTCILLRRTAFQTVGGYDETIFMYCEDVEISYKFRKAGFILRYCPMSVVYHYTYSYANEVKPLQYIGSIFGNLYLRLKYGHLIDILKIPIIILKFLVLPNPPNIRTSDIISEINKLIIITPKVLINRLYSNNVANVNFTFHNLDYEIVRREGAFYENQKMPNKTPLVSIITRTYQGRECLLRQALLSVAHQTYPAIEHIVVEDNGNQMLKVVQEIAQLTGKNITFIHQPKIGRSKAGNVGLSKAKGKWCLFLDDDDLLFSDHVEVLVNALIKTPRAAAAYSLSSEVITHYPDFSKSKYKEMIHKISPIMYQKFSRRLLRKYNYLPIQTVLFSRSLFKKYGGFNTNMDVLEDWILWNKYAKDNFFIYVPKCTSMYRTPFNIKHNMERKRAFQDNYEIACNIIKQFYLNTS